ncbi:virginiamycin B lyase [Umezawaea endophytica]|uniref:Virginiamycin B lyase n=1 Tax=Umezawaea endophytica TaxID=1654476 RepID=A0A9X3A1A7_9PSEU|nr:virginiamycin B lyase [Umezawaea endophytica]MCS7479399.1 virginiamycin B lyase [Umezawaea endophytica]
MVRASIVLVVGALLIGCTTGTGPSPAPTADRPTAVRLPEGAFPRFLTVSADGVVWCVENSGESIARLDRNGDLDHFRVPGESNGLADVTTDPGGAAWFTGLLLVGRISPDGDLGGWRDEKGGPRVGLPNALTAGPDGAIWYTNEKTPPAISRITAAGTITDHEIPTTDGLLDLPGITAGPDHALWFTENSTAPGAAQAVGRMAVDGAYTRFPLSGSGSGPHRITTGPDGALWFTLLSGAIGRIAVDGALSEFPLPGGGRPFDITAGYDGALWFSTDRPAIGRITTNGEITLHPVEGAKRLTGIGAAPDGALWVADGEADALWRYTPAR